MRAQEQARWDRYFLPEQRWGRVLSPGAITPEHLQNSLHRNLAVVTALHGAKFFPKACVALQRYASLIAGIHLPLRATHPHRREPHGGWLRKFVCKIEPR